MHTKGKWMYRIDPYDIKIFQDRKEPSGAIATIHNFTNKSNDAEANAKRIVQMHNSFDEIVNALKALVNFDAEKDASGGHKLLDLIADAEDAIEQAE